MVPSFQYVKYWTDFYSTFQGGKEALTCYNKAAVFQVGLLPIQVQHYAAAKLLSSFGFSTTSHFILNQVHLKCRVHIGLTF